MIKNHRKAIGCSSVLVIICATVGLVMSSVEDSMPANRLTMFVAIFTILLVAGFVALYSNYQDINYDKKLAILYSRGEDDEYKYVPRREKEKNNQFFPKLMNFLFRKETQSKSVDVDYELSDDNIVTSESPQTVGYSHEEKFARKGTEKNYGSIETTSHNFGNSDGKLAANSMIESAELDIKKSCIQRK
ncbi:hypothetical protein [Ehrlichia ruminantium]|uniref:hypothetical protein n=1 Tax=Ehrlichia ruminantium TaxID=779 RepID=UPI001FC870D3|nr:hypothetical protein [Ehrlichia ruminantium]UOD98232.1 hypothetical protein IMW64_01975 [Ehrlichia ruminantium]